MERERKEVEYPAPLVVCLEVECRGSVMCRCDVRKKFVEDHYTQNQDDGVPAVAQLAMG